MLFCECVIYCISSFILFYMGLGRQNEVNAYPYRKPMIKLHSLTIRQNASMFVSRFMCKKIHNIIALTA